MTTALFVAIIGSGVVTFLGWVVLAGMIRA